MGTVRKLLQALRILQSGEVIARQSGICPNVTYTLNALGVSDQGCGRWIRETAKLWPSYSGAAFYPVPDPEALEADVSIEDKMHYAEEIYDCTSDMWAVDTAYGMLRHSLLDFLIARAEAQLKGEV